MLPVSTSQATKRPSEDTIYSPSKLWHVHQLGTLTVLFSPGSLKLSSLRLSGLSIRKYLKASLSFMARTTPWAVSCMEYISVSSRRIVLISSVCQGKEDT